jgi:D-alanyl-D-alanine carboxypeptidase
MRLLHMTKFNLHSVLFAVTVFAFVFLGERSTHDLGKVSSTNAVTRTSLAEASAPFTPPVNNSAIAAPHALAPKAVTSALNNLPQTDTTILLDAKIGAQSIFVQEIGTAGTLYAVHEREGWPLASITKLVTALVARDFFSPGTPIGVTEEAIAIEGAAGGFSPGEVFSAEDLIKAALGVSSNDAAEALARAAGYDAFIAAMQKKAAEIGMRNTSFFDPTGLSPLNLSTAEDLGVLTNYILAQAPDLFMITRTERISITETNSQTPRTLRNNNLFAGKPWFVGGKTGFTDDAQGNLLSVVSYGDRRFMIAVLGSNDRFGETEKIIQWISSKYL